MLRGRRPWSYDAAVRENKPSNTALGVVVVRAVHQLMDELPHILEDPVSPRLLSPETIQEIQAHPGRHRLPQSRGLRSAVVLRSRYAEDELMSAVHSGLTQFVSIGAGYDTFACRQPAWAHGLRILEVDHPATQAAKREHFARMGVAFPENVAFLPHDLEAGELARALPGNGIDPTAPVFVACLGVLTYLRPHTVERLLGEIAAMASGTRMVFTIASAERPHGTSTEDRAAAHGEPWLTRLDRGELEAVLRESGFRQVSFLEPEESALRYYAGRHDLEPPQRMRMCLAAV